MRKLYKVFLIFLLSFFAFNILDAQENSDYERYSIFIKKDDKGNIVEDAIFAQKSLDGTIIKIISYNSLKNPNSNQNLISEIVLEDGYPFLVSSENSELAYNLLTSEQKEIFNNMKTLDDYNQFIDSLPSITGKSPCNDKQDYINYYHKSKGIFKSEGIAKSNVLNNNIALLSNNYGIQRLQSDEEINAIDFNVQSYMYIEEIKVPYKLEKEIVVVPINISVSISVLPDNSLRFNGYSFNAGSIDITGLYKYDSGINYDSIEDAFDKITDDHVYSTTCGNTPPYCSGARIMAGNLYCYPIIVDKTNDEDISKKATIESYVDGKQRAHSMQNEEVTITVKLTNTARTPLYENVVVSNIPEGFEYVDASAIKDGVYNRENNTITWQLDYLDANDSELYSYKVKVPDTADLNKLYNTTAKLSTRGIDTPIVSDEAVVDLGSNESSNDIKENPKTGSFNQIILVLIAVVSTIGLIYLQKSKSIKQNL